MTFLLLLAACLARAEAPFSNSARASAPSYPLAIDGRLSDALLALREALTRSLEESGPDSASTAQHRRNLALGLWHYGDFKAAQAEMKRALACLPENEAGAAGLELKLLEGDMKGLPRPGPAGDSFEGLAAQAREARLKKKYKEALKLAEKAEAAGRVKFIEPAHPFLAPAWEEIGLAQGGLGKPDLKIQYLEMALEGRRRSGGLLHYSSLPHHEAEARILESLGRKAEARELWIKILELRGKSQSAAHPALKLIAQKIESLK